MDPELTVRLVKQNLNKDLDTLQLELDLRPNNNDLSVMSIIQGRQCSMRQSKPGLVLVDLEEMPDTQTQVAVAQLLSQRFAGRKGSYGSNQARNSNKRGISGDAKIAAIFTSNYELSQESQQALQSIEMFSNLHPVHLKAVSGVEREQFARTYLQQRVQDRLSTVEHCHVNLDMSLGQGDTRLLVRKLRMLAFYVCAVAQGNLKAVGPLQTSVVQTKRSYHVAVGMDTLQLKTGLLETLLPLAPQIFNKRTGEAMDLFTQSSNGDPVVACDGLSMVLEYWFSNTLAPAVIISRNPRMVSRVAEAVASLANVHSILGVDAGSYKIMKSLYDQKDTPNLREDILKFGRGAQVAVELHCETTEAQMAIRELIEDTPSMTAFSSERSALYKRGLLFLVYCKDEITPEILSRASLVM